MSFYPSINQQRTPQFTQQSSIYHSITDYHPLPNQQLMPIYPQIIHDPIYNHRKQPNVVSTPQQQQPQIDSEPLRQTYHILDTDQSQTNDTEIHEIREICMKFGLTAALDLEKADYCIITRTVFHPQLFQFLNVKKPPKVVTIDRKNPRIDNLMREHELMTTIRTRYQKNDKFVTELAIFVRVKNIDLGSLSILHAYFNVGSNPNSHYRNQDISERIKIVCKKDTEKAPSTQKKRTKKTERAEGEPTNTEKKKLLSNAFLLVSRGKIEWIDCHDHNTDAVKWLQDWMALQKFNMTVVTPYYYDNTTILYEDLLNMNEIRGEMLLPAYHLDVFSIFDFLNKAPFATHLHDDDVLSLHTQADIVCDETTDGRELSSHAEITKTMELAQQDEQYVHEQVQEFVGGSVDELPPSKLFNGIFGSSKEYSSPLPSELQDHAQDILDKREQKRRKLSDIHKWMDEWDYKAASLIPDYE
jgi:hypothetical protein